MSPPRTTVRRQVLVRPRSPRRVYVRETTKTRRPRKVRFDPMTSAALRRWRAEQAREQLAFGGAWKAHGGLAMEPQWVVTEPDGAVVHPDTLLAQWRRLAEASGVPAITLHGLDTPTPCWPSRQGPGWTW